MSYITIADFIKSGRQSLAAKNYWSALSVALMLPSMCSRLAYSDTPKYHWPNGLGFFFSINDDGIYTEMTKCRIVSVTTLCEQIFFNVENWCCKFGSESGSSSFTHTQVFDREIKDDRLSYQRLCDEDRTDHLKEQFDKKNTAKQLEYDEAVVLESKKQRG